MLCTSRRSVSQTTDSTRSGWTTKRSAANAAPHEIEEHRVGGVERQVAQVIAPRIHAAQGVVQSEREPRQRDPVPLVRRGEHPAQVAPAESAEMVVNGRHFEDALPAQLVGAHLKDHREGFDHEDAADDHERQHPVDQGHRQRTPEVRR